MFWQLVALEPIASYFCLGALRLNIKILADPEQAFYQSQMRNVNFELALLKVGTQRALAFLGTLSLKSKI